MKKDLIALFFLSAITVLVYRFAFLTFFAQDDFILINYFSQNNWMADVKNVVLSTDVTHWRPIHNLYFFISGNLFGKNFIFYHLLTFIFHIGASFFIYKIIAKLFKRNILGLLGGLLYAVHPAHFVSLFWISGGATTIGFFFLASSLHSYLIGRKSLSLILFVLGLLASEAMIVGLGIYLIWSFLSKQTDKNFVFRLLLICTVFAFLKFLTLINQNTFSTYPLSLSPKIIQATKYYILRILGFGEISGDFVSTLLIIIFISTLAFLSLAKIKRQNTINLFFALSIILFGLFPFIFIPSHLSPHYMNVSIFGLSLAFVWILSQQSTKVITTIFCLFLVSSVLTINLTRSNNWVIKRSNLAKLYIEKIENADPAAESAIIFGDNPLSTSHEAYFALGGGKALDFWFTLKRYNYCFSAFENCSRLP